MALNLEEYFHNGITYKQFLEKSDSSQNMEWFYEHTSLSDEQHDFLKNIDRQINLLVVASDWCIDSQANVPVIAKIVDTSPCVDLRIIIRDDNEDFMDNYLTNGSRKIPLCLMLSPEFQEVERWVERPAAVYQMLLDIKDSNAKGDLIYAKFKRRYRSQEAIDAAVEEILNRLRRAELILLHSRKFAEEG